MALYEKYLEKSDFTSLEDFLANFKIKKPKSFNFAYDVMDVLAAEKPDKRALVWCNEAGDERFFTFGELKQLSDKTANFFTSIGIKKGDPVMVVLKRHYEFWMCILALHKIGAVIIPATHLLTVKDVVYRNNAADIKYIVSTAQGNITASVDEAQKDTPSLLKKIIVNGTREGWISFNEGVEAASESFTPPADYPCNDDPMILYFTSGTTGYPKMVRHDFYYPLGHIITAKYWHNVTEDGLHLTASDTGWAKSIWGKLYGQWLCETAIFVYDIGEKFQPTDFLKAIEKYRITTFCAPPTIYRFLIKEDLSKYDLDCLKYCTTAGEPLNPEVYNKFYEQTGIKLMEGFGQTETTLQAATFVWQEPSPGSMGIPSPLYNLDIIRDDGTSCDTGETGEIIIYTKGELPVGLFMGYYRDDEKTKSVWNNDIYRTGDLAWKDENGFLWYVGRNDDIIKSSGYRIGPFEVESALLEHPSVLECAITAVPDEIRGQIIKATIVLAKGYEPSDELKKTLQEHVKHVTAPYKYPRIIEFVASLPKTISGKIRRVEIREKDTK